MCMRDGITAKERLIQLELKRNGMRHYVIKKMPSSKANKGTKKYN